MAGVDRRTFLKAAAGGAALTSARQRAGFHFIKQLIPGRPTRTPIKHLVVVMMENRSVDHYLGWYGKENPNFDARQAMTVPDLRVGHAGQTRTTANWGVKGLKNFHGRGHPDPNHGWDGGRAEFARGQLNGWLDPKTRNDEFCLSYYDDIDVPVWAQLTRDYQTYDRWFCSTLGPTMPNRYYLHSGQSAGITTDQTPPELAADHSEWRLGFNWPTMWDLYERFGVSASFYFSNLPELGYWGARHVSHMRHISQWYEQCQAGTLPQISVLAPYYQVNGLGNDDHPHADLRLGQALLSDIVETFVHSRHYRQGALAITYDEWGGFFDHVAPPRLADDRATPNDPGGALDFGQLGFRVPSTIVSPWTRLPGRVDHTVYEHTSINRFIAENWNLPYLTTRVRATASIGRAFGGFRAFDPEPRFAPYDAPSGTLRISAVDAVNETINNSAKDPTALPLIKHVPGAPPWPGPPLPVPKNPVPGGSKHDRDGLVRLLEMGWFDKFKIRTDWKFEDSFVRSRPDLLRDTRP